MQSRRSFMRTLAAAAAGMGFSRLLPAAGAQVTESGPLLAVGHEVRAVPGNPNAADVAIQYQRFPNGIPGVRPPWGSGVPAIHGVPGETYFLSAKYDTPNGMHVYFDGADVHNECGEADLVGGWVRLLPVRLRTPEGVVFQFTGGDPFVMRGKVEIRPGEKRKPRGWRDEHVMQYARGRYYHAYQPMRWDSATRTMVPDGPTHLDVRGKLTPWDQV